MRPGPEGVLDAVAVEFDTKSSPAPERWSCLELQAATTPETTYTFSFSVQGPEGSFLAARKSQGMGPHQVSGSVVRTSGPCTASVYVKPQGRNAVILSVASDDAIAKARFDLTAEGTTAACTGGHGRIESVGQGWYRVALTTDAGVRDGATFSIALFDALGGQADYAGDGTSGLLVWGPQLEPGTRATSYIPTFFVPETRGADEPVTAPSP